MPTQPKWWDVLVARAPGTPRRVLPVALLVGIVSGYAAIGFYWLLTGFTWLFLNATDEKNLLEFVKGLPWWQVFGAPVIGGLCVGITLACFTKAGRAGAIADVMAAALSRGSRRTLTLSSALISTFISTLSLGAGASAGREGPAVHLCASIASFIAVRTGVAGRDARTLLGAAAAAAVSASFNAPIAGILFAHEVILRHYSVRAMAPIAIAAVSGAVISRIHMGTSPAFDLPSYVLVSYLELPAFAGLGIVAGLVSIAFVLSIREGDRLAMSLRLPLWLRPALGGLCIGTMALWVPEIMSVGYGAVDNTLHELYGWRTLAVLIVAKMAATAITLASRFGGGIFSPSLYLGAVTGGLFGIGIALIFPEQTSSYGFYALVGMGAVAAAVLRAPISTTLIVFEMTGDYNMTIALLVSASIATLSNQAALREGIFEWQLLGRGLDIRKGTYMTVAQTVLVADFMEEIETPYDLEDARAPVVHPDTPLETALVRFEDSGADILPVVARSAPARVIGLITYKRALEAYNKGLIDTNIEEHL